MNLGRIIFIPASRPPHKNSHHLVGARHRLAMIRLAIRPFSQFQVSSIELRRRGFSYTIDTVRSMKRELGAHAALFFIIGEDNLAEVRTWKNYAELLEECQFVAVRRKIIDPKSIPVMIKKKIILLKTPVIPISSSQIRERIKRGKDIRRYVPFSVFQYLQRYSLYKS